MATPFTHIDDVHITSTGASTLAKHADSRPCGCVPHHGNPTCTDHRCVNFSTLTECGPRCHKTCQNRRIQKREYAPLEVKPTPGKGFGLFTVDALKAQQFVREYVGELIDEKEFQQRTADRARTLEHTYMLQLQKNAYIDATHKASVSRFINHSCQPNCDVEIWTVLGHLRVGIFALDDVTAMGELTFDYKW
eukprot:CAMPEP_0173187352 /NCGR_PEP_ID=MMETSP1141-20130122/10656_1 /TAXON_ID=483371 /ORGANISM="non described non described, Strain CCMP2298" /LENGTH=191 /DNA_ID=CAMNT_0014111169 /DNA_START=368 /DNA_END=940 /DNA_ORIENTATION=+